MDVSALGTPEIVGIGGVAVAFGVLIWRIFQLTAQMNNKLIDVIEANAKAHQKLASTVEGLEKSIDKNTDITSKTGAMMEKTNDTLSKLLLDMFTSTTPKRRK